MSTAWQSQRSKGHYNLQFETDDEQKYKLVEKAAQMAIDGKLITNIEEVNHGEWIEEKIQSYLVHPMKFDENREPILQDCITYKCSLCGRKEHTEEPYCNCGAKMDGGKKKND